MKHLIYVILHKAHIVVIEIEHAIWRLLLKNRDFTIISNNCWGGTIYQYLRLQYNTPTIGCIIFPKDYVKFCGNLHWYLEQELCFIDIKDGKYFNQLTSNGEKAFDFPLAKLDDIEIYFMHYKNEDEAREKWNRRKKRVNYSNILFKFSERDGCSPNAVKEFSNILGTKLIFTKNKYDDIPNSIYIQELKEVDKIGISEVGLTLNHCNIVKILNQL